MDVEKFKTANKMNDWQLISERDLAWFAGIVDGEGSINITTCKDKYHKALGRFALNFEITMTHLPTMERINSMWGIGGLYVHQKGSKIGKPCWLWMVRANQALAILEIVYPYLFTKREAAEIGIAFQRRRRDEAGKWRKGSPIRDTMARQDEVFYRKLHEQNYAFGVTSEQMPLN
jgi:hypothetical protein